MFKPFAVLVLLGGIPVASYAQSTATSPATPAAKDPLAAAVLADGTPVKLRVSRGTNTAGLRVGDTAELEVVQDVKVGDITVISTNNVATAVVTAQHARTSKSDSGRVDADLHSVTLVDGETVALRTVRQPSSSSQAVVASSAWQDVVLADGIELTAYVAGNLKLDLTRMQLAASPAGELRISSTPSNAEISIDGRVLGMAPYTAHVNRGEHIVVLRAAGYEPWRRTVSLSSDAVDLQAQLARQDNTEATPQAKVAPPSLGELARQARAKKAAEAGQKPAGDASGDASKTPTRLQD